MPAPASPESLSTVEYLVAKKAIDDRALNARVWSALRQAIAPQARPQVIEVGCGIGTMLERMIERELLSSADYLGVDLSEQNILEAPSRLTQWADRLGYTATAGPGGVRITGRGASIAAEFAQADVFDFLEIPGGKSTWDLLVAHAFLDLVDIPSALQQMLPAIKPGGLFYFSLVFDGLTVLEPELDPSLDRHILELYHRSMDEGTMRGLPSGESRSGRHLFRRLREAGANLLEVGGSDWVVFARGGAYSREEADFLGWILKFIESSLAGHPELEANFFEDWIEQRRLQLGRGELVYIAHQLDFLGRLG